MSSPTAFYLQPLSWHQIASRPETYELRAIPGTVATLRFAHKYEAIATFPQAEWRFRSRGWFRKTADIFQAPSTTPIASCRLGYWSASAILALSATRILTLAANSWDKTYVVRTERGALVFAYDFRGFFSLRSPLTWGEDSAPAQELPWLIPFAWYLAVRYYHDVIEAAGAVVVAG